MSCDDCHRVESESGDYCPSEHTECYDNPDCASLIESLEECGDGVCVSDCNTDYWLCEIPCPVWPYRIAGTGLAELAPEYGECSFACPAAGSP